jgi:ribosomal protein S18 acetylase RimI-like enzyme
MAPSKPAPASKMVEIRPYRASDLDKLYDICLATGDAGEDAAPLYRDPKLLGHVYAGPYAALAPDAIFVVEDEEGVGGYILGARNTLAFEAALVANWWPSLRALYPDVAAAMTPDERMQRLIHHPPCTSRPIADAYPAHLHIDLLPRLRGKGVGRRMIDTWREVVRVSTHLAVGERNARAVRFYRAYGFHEIERFDAFDVIVFGIG